MYIHTYLYSYTHTLNFPYLRTFIAICLYISLEEDSEQDSPRG